MLCTGWQPRYMGCVFRPTESVMSRSTSHEEKSPAVKIELVYNNDSSTEIISAVYEISEVGTADKISEGTRTLRSLKNRSISIEL